LEIYFLESGYKCTMFSWKFKAHTKVVWSEDCVVTRLRAGKQRNFGSIAGRGKRYFFSP
jgi:hypothetical protein